MPAQNPPSPPDPESSVHTEDLLGRYRAGDPQALNQLLNRYYSRVERMVRVRMGRFLKSREDVGDVVQDVFVRVLSGIERFESRGDAKFIDWLVRMVQRELANHSRRERTQKRGGDLAELVRLHAESASNFEVSAQTTGIASKVANREMEERVDACLGRLSEPHRVVILLREYAGADWKTVAETMGRVTHEACQELFRRARIELLKRLQQDGEAEARG